MYEKFQVLLEKSNKTAYGVAKDTGISTSTFSNWKNGRYTPKTDKLKILADYFGVSIEYFLEDNQEKGEWEVMFFRRKPERNIPEPMRMPITLVQGYEVFTDHIFDLSLVQFSVPYHEWRKLEESKEWKAFQALFEKAQEQ